MTRETKYAHCLLRIIIAVDKSLNFTFLKAYARRQHNAFSLDDEKQIVALIRNSVLDIGCGMGYWGLHLMSADRVTVAIELSRVYVHFAKLLGVYNSVIRASADALPIRPDCFNTALALEIIEHLDKTSGYSLINEAKRVSSCVIVSTPQNPWSNLDLPDWVPKTEHHFSSWSKEDLRLKDFKTSTLGESILAVHIKN